MTRKLLTIMALAGLIATSLSAQQPGGIPQGGGRYKTPDPVLFNGPPVPEDFLDLVALDSAQYNAYRNQYTNFMEQTRPQRDSLLDFRRQMRDAFQSGAMNGAMGGGMPQGGSRQTGRPGGGGRDKMQKTLSELEKQQKVFDEELKVLLQEPQYKKYEKWRKDEMARAEREMRERWGSGGGPPQ